LRVFWRNDLEVLREPGAAGTGSPSTTPARRAGAADEGAPLWARGGSGGAAGCGVSPVPFGEGRNVAEIAAWVFGLKGRGWKRFHCECELKKIRSVSRRGAAFLFMKD